jgi:uncharacterized protein (TIRG00374 family)
VSNRLKIVLGAVVGLGLIYFFVRDLDAKAVLETIGHADWRLLAGALGLIFTTYVIRAFRWRVLLNPVAPRASFSSLFGATALGFSAVFLAGRTGEVVRPVALSSREHIRPSASFATILIERVFDMATVVLLFALDLLIVDVPLADEGTMARIRWAGIIMLALTIAGVVGLYLLHHHRVAVTEFLDRKLRRFGRRVRKGIVSVVGNFAEALSILHDGRELVVVSAWSLLLWVVCAACNALVFEAFGFDLPAGASIFVLGFGLIGSLVPTPGGAAGAFHFATAAGIALLGVAESDAKSAAIIIHLLSFGSALPLGLLVLIRGGYSLSRLRAALREDLNSISDVAHAVDFDTPIGGLAHREEINADR